jgi:hypothetical protein
MFKGAESRRFNQLTNERENTMIFIVLGVVVICLGLWLILDSGIHQPIILHMLWIIIAMILIQHGCKERAISHPKPTVKQHNN